MSIRRTAGLCAALFAVSTAAFAQTDTARTMTVSGCLIKEADYRKAHGLGKGALGGAGLGDEFVLVDATEISTPTNPSASTTAAAPTTSENCTETGTGSAYRLTGKREKELKSFVGRKMEITGRFDHARDARTAAGQTNAKLPAEILIASYRQASGPVSETPTATSGSVATPPAEAPKVEPSGELPKSASDEPLLALISLASFSAALGVRFVRRRAS